jgi:hypothetical protein
MMNAFFALPTKPADPSDCLKAASMDLEALRTAPLFDDDAKTDNVC